MTPTPAKTYPANKRWGDAEIHCDCRPFFAAITPPPNFNHIAGSKFGAAVAFTSGLSAFCNRVSRVFGAGSKKQMRGINAWPIVAVVADALAFWYRAAVHLPTYSVSLPVKKDTVAKTDGCGPKPTVSRLVHLGPEGLHKTPLLPTGNLALQTSATFGAISSVQVCQENESEQTAVALANPACQLQTTKTDDHQPAKPLACKVNEFAVRWMFDFRQVLGRICGGFDHISRMVDRLVKSARNNGRTSRLQDASLVRTGQCSILQ